MQHEDLFWKSLVQHVGDGFRPIRRPINNQRDMEVINL
jgi:hypothetical protein